MPITAAQLDIKYTSSGGSKVKSEAKEVGAAVEDAGKKGHGFLSNMLSTAGGMVIENAFSNITSKVIGFGSGLIMANANAETFRNQLNIAVGDAEKAGELFDWLKGMAKDTPFEFPELLQGSANLEALGLSAQKWMPIIGDTAAGTNKSIDQVVQAVLDASSGEFERLKEFGIRSKVEGDKVKFSFMKNGKEMTIEAENTQEGIQNALMGIWDQKYDGAMDTLSNTFMGRLSTLKDNITMMMQDAGKPLFDFFNKGLVFANDFFSAFSMDGLTKGMDLLGKVSISLQYAFMKAFGPETGGKIAATIRDIEGTLRTIGGVISQVAGVVRNVLGSAFSLLADNIGTVMSVIKGLGIVIGSMLAYGAVTAIITGIGAALAALLSPMMLVIAAVVALTIAWDRNLFGIQEKTAAVFGFVMDTVGKVVSYLQKAFSGGFMSGILNIFSDIGGAIDALASKFAPLRALLDSMAPAFNAIGQAVASMTAYFVNAFSGGITEGFAKIAADVILLGSKFPPLVKLLKSLVAPFNKLKDVAKDLGDAFRKIASGDYSGAFDSLKDAARGLFDAITDIGSAIYEFLGDLSSIARSGIDKLFDSLKEKFGAFSGTFDRLNGIIGNFLGVLGGVYNAISALLSGDWGGVWDGLVDATASAGKIILNAIGLIPQLLFDLFRAIDWGGVWDALTAAWDAIPWSDMASKAVDLLLAGLRGASSKAGDLFGWMSDALTNALNNMSDVMMTGLQLAWDSIADIDWKSFIPDLSWSTFITLLDWALWLGDKALDVASWIKDKITELDLGSLLDVGIDLVTWIKEKIIELDLGSLLDVGIDLVTWIKEKIIELDLGSLLDVGIDLVTWIKEKILELDLGSLLGVGIDLVTWIKEKILELDLGSLLDVGIDLVTWIKEKIIELDLGSLLDVGIDLVTWIKEKILELDLGSLLDVGIDLVTWIKEKITELDLGSLLDVGIDLVTWIKDKILELDLGSLLDVGIDLVTWIKEKILELDLGSLLDSTWDLMGWIKEKILELNLPGLISNITPDSIWQLFVDAIPAIDWPELPSADDIRTWVKEAISGWFSSDNKPSLDDITGTDLEDAPEPDVAKLGSVGYATNPYGSGGGSSGGLGGLKDALGRALDEAKMTVETKLEEIKTSISTATMGWVTAVNTNLLLMQTGVMTSMAAVQLNISTAMANISPKISTAVMGWVTAVNTNLLLMQTGVMTSMSAIQRNIETAMSALADTVRSKTNDWNTQANTNLLLMQTGVMNAMSAIQQNIETAMSSLSETVRSNTMNWVSEANGNLLLMQTGVMNAMSDINQNIETAMSNATSTISSESGSWDGIISGANLYGAGRDVMAGLNRGIQDGWVVVRSTLQWISNQIPSWKGPPEKDKRLLKPAGQLVMGGFKSGLESMFPDIFRTLGNFTDSLSGKASLGADFMSPRAALGVPSGENTFTVNNYITQQPGENSEDLAERVAALTMTKLREAAVGRRG